MPDIEYQTLDEVPWNSGTVKSVIGPNGNTVGLSTGGSTIWLTGPRKGQIIPLDANGPWVALPGKVEIRRLAPHQRRTDQHPPRLG